MLARPAPRPQALMPRLVDSFDQQARDVVVASRAFGAFNQLRARRFQITRSVDNLEHSFVAYKTRQTVAAQQENVIAQELVVGEIRLYAVFGSQGAYDHVLHAGMLGLLLCDQPASNLLHHQGVIRRERLNAAGTQQINAAVAYMRNRK